MHHRLLAFSFAPALLALVLSFVLCACSEPTEDNPPETNNASSNNASSNNAHNSGPNHTSNHTTGNNASNNNGVNNPNNASNNALPCPQPNACGGCEPLDAQPGSPCGPCNDGALACDGTDTLACQNASNLNACGGCAPLEAEPGEPCGPCNEGALACEGTDALSCQGASDLNICGGCTHLEGAPGDRCGRCNDGTLACEGTDALTCQGATDTCPREGDRCDDGDDNDGDGMVDCEDDECSGTPQCPDGSCVDVDLGSALGRPVTDITAAGWGNDLDDACLGPEEDIIFRWTAPRDGVFAFDATDLAPRDFIPRIQLVPGDCRAEQALCGGPGGLVAGGASRTIAVTPLRQGESILIVVEDGTTLGIMPNEIPSTSAGLALETGQLASISVAADLTGDLRPEILLRSANDLGYILRLLPRDPPELPWAPLYDYRAVFTNLYAGDEIAPFGANFDVDGDGFIDLLIPHYHTNPSGYLHRGPVDWEEPTWSVEPLDEARWRPPIAWGDLTGDGVVDLVTWQRDPSLSALPTRWVLYSDIQTAWSPSSEPLIQLDSTPTPGRTARVCDFNGDGAQDLLFLERDLTGENLIRLLHGPLTAQTSIDDALVLGPYSWRYDENGGAFTTEDLNGDGACDVVLGNPNNDPISPSLSRGDLRIFYGPLPALLEPQEASVRFGYEDAQAYWGLGQSITTGDINGDGYVDLAFSAPAAQRQSNPQMASTLGGLIFIFWGPLRLIGDVNPTRADRIVTTYETSSDPPWFVSLGTLLTAGDLDGDGFAELLTHREGFPSTTFIFSGKRITDGRFVQEVSP